MTVTDNDISKVLEKVKGTEQVSFTAHEAGEDEEINDGVLFTSSDDGYVRMVFACEGKELEDLLARVAFTCLQMLGINLDDDDEEDQISTITS